MQNSEGRFVSMTAAQLAAWFDENIIPIPECGCWLWTGNITKAEYGVTCHRYMHRYSYETHIGPIPAGMHVLHRCDVPSCVNPNHLFLGTQRDNNDDKMAKGRASGGGMKGESHPQAKLTEPDVVKIRQLIAGGDTQTGTAKRFGISQGQVWAIVNRRLWKHV